MPKVYKFTRGPKGASRWQKAISPPQELKVGTHRAPYLLVLNTEEEKYIYLVKTYKDTKGKYFKKVLGP